MMQGLVCHARGVELATAGAARVHARVRSKRIHDVLLRADRGRLIVACTCPARSFGLDVCKHAWAALLEVDRHDGLSDLRKTHGPLVVEAAPADVAPAATSPSPPPTANGTGPAPSATHATKRAKTTAARSERAGTRSKTPPSSAPSAPRAKARSKGALEAPAAETTGVRTKKADTATRKETTTDSPRERAQKSSASTRLRAKRR
jgi:SWIM zinc finger